MDSIENNFMKAGENKTIWTIGHSTHSFKEFLNMLQSAEIALLVDIRSFPGSRKFSQFNKDALAASLPEHELEYIHLKSLGGRRKVRPNSKNTAWRNASFRGYADYMETEEFSEGLEKLKNLASKKRTAYMCSEAVWWRCHRSMVSDVLKAQGWEVMHIMAVGKANEHPYTQPAKIVDGKLSYEEV